MSATKKNTSGWILCPSKSFPGKFYYFNILNGKAAWSGVDDVDKANTKNVSHMYKVTDKCHCYPEPSHPPDDHPDDFHQQEDHPSLHTNDQLNQSSFGSREILNPPVFGQATFSNYLSNVPYTPNMVWSLVPIMLGQPNVNGSQMFNKVTQTFTDQFDVHCCKLPLNQRFTRQNCSMNNEFNINEKSNNLNPDTKLKSTETFTQSNIKFRSQINETSFNINNSPENFNAEIFQQSTPNKEYFEIKYPSVSKRKRTQSESTINEPTYKVHNTVTINGNSKDSEGIELDIEPSKLDMNDLRHRIEAKRRKSIDIGYLENKLNNDNLQSPTQHNDWFCLDYDEEETPVRNNLNEANEETCGLREEVPIPTQSVIEKLRNLSKPNSKSVWYIVTDTHVLMQHSEFIENFVKQDDNCRLVIPHTVHTEIISLSSGESRGRVAPLAARHLVRQLASKPSHVILQPDDKVEFELSSSDKIVQCCMQALSRRYHVVLVTNNPELIKKSKCNNIHTITTNELQNGRLLEQSNDSFEQIKKIKISFENNTEKENLFMQTPDGYKNKNNIPINCFKSKLFDQLERHNDASTSPIDFDKLISETRPNEKVTIAEGNNSDAIASEISQGIEYLKTYFNKELENLENKIQILRTFDFQNDRQTPCKLNAASNIENTKRLKQSFDEMQGFYKSSLIKERIKSRIDEWCCIFTQIMEDVLFHVIQKSLSINVTGIFNLQEAVIKVGSMFKSNPRVKYLVEKLCNSLVKLETSKPECVSDSEFMKILSYGVLFVQTLMSLLPQIEELKDANNSLLNLFKHIESPSSDESSQNIKLPSHVNKSEMDNNKPRSNFTKKPAEIINYLKQNFPEWRTYSENETSLSNNIHGTNIIRTTGANIGKLKLRITNDKCNNTLSFDNTINKSTTQPKIIRQFNNITIKKTIQANDEKKQQDIEKYQNKIQQNDSTNRNKSETEQRTFGDFNSNEQSKYKPFTEQKIDRVSSNDNCWGTKKTEQKNNRASIESTTYQIQEKISKDEVDIRKVPKVIRNIILQDAFGEMKKSASSKDSGIINNDTLQYESSFNNNSVAGSRDSCYGSGSEEAYYFARYFLNTFSSTFKRVYNFAKDATKELRVATISEDKYNIILDKANRSLVEMDNIIEKLKCIIDRESNERSEFKSFILQNAVAARDTRVTNYGKVVLKCLEQTRTLRDVLKTIISTQNDVTSNASSESITANMDYINIFE